MTRVISKAGRARMAAAGAKMGAQNVAQWRARARTRANDIRVQVDSFRAGLLRDASANLTTTKAGLIEAAVTTYAGILRLRYSVISGSKREALDAVERVSWLTSNLFRSLKTLNLDYVPPPRSLADLVEPKQQI
jgi:hypothetical protein